MGSRTSTHTRKTVMKRASTGFGFLPLDVLDKKAARGASFGGAMAVDDGSFLSYAPAGKPIGWKKAERVISKSSTWSTSFGELSRISDPTRRPI